MMKKTLWTWAMAVVLTTVVGGCAGEELDYDHPDVDLFVKQLKAGTYQVTNEKGLVEAPHFGGEHIPALLEYATDMTVIPSFPTLYNAPNGKLRLGECMLWVIERIRLGTPPSQGCKLVRADADNYEATYFLTDEEVADAAACYRQWWQSVAHTRVGWRSMAPYAVEPLDGTPYRWW